MARNTYTPDEFDRLPEGSPAGVHRRVPRPWTRFAFFCAVILTSIGLAWGVARVFLIADDVPFLQWIRSAFEGEPQVTPAVIPSPTPSPSPSPSPSPNSTPTYDLALDASITVFNDSDIASLAANVQGYVLSDTGFTVVSVDNWEGAAPPVNTVRYSTEEFEDSARYLASLFGITSITIGPTEGVDIEIILISDVPLGPSPSPTLSATP